MNNPYDEFLVDEVSGIKVPSEKHQIWEEGYRSGKEDRRIKDVVKYSDGMVMVFDARGEQMPAYQGRYDQVKAKILARAPASTKFFHGTWNIFGNAISRKDW